MPSKGNPFKYTKSSKQEDDELLEDFATVDMEASRDGSSVSDISSLLGILEADPKERRRKSERLAMYILLGFLALMGCMWWKLGQNNENAMGSGTISGNSDGTVVYCNGVRTTTLYEWLEGDIAYTRGLCDPKFQPERQVADVSKPVKVFILMGEANMVGTGTVYGNVSGALDYTVKNKKRFTHLVDADKNWRSRSDVKYVAVDGDFNLERNEWLGVHEENEGHKHFGPELQMGYILGELLDSPVLILKASTGHESLGGDLLPPGSESFDYGGYTYAGYGDSPRRWVADTEPTETSWYAGHAYDTHLANIRTVLVDIDKFYPGATSYEIGGFAFWQGDSDRRDSAYVAKYRSNLKFFIDNIRTDLNAEDAKFAIATLGQQGKNMEGDTLEVLESQVDVGTRFRSFLGNVATVDIRSSWRTEYLPGHEGDNSQRDAVHYGNNAETIMEVGNALGLAMVQLMRG
eukprot:Nitzschia sp. Nitz4//scaffold10_size219509//53385//54844//NITZ4_001410-RA/size219509-augustus-gene-0.219-mRNA-1//1//CDS//3329532866//8922//frame0